MHDELLLDVRDVRVSFLDRRRELPVVYGASFDVHPGEIVGLVGESGCGKSLTCRTILGLLPRNARLTHGQIVLDGTDLAGLPEKQRAACRGRLVGMIPQDPLTSLNPVLTIGDQLLETIRRHRMLSRRDAREVALELLRRVQIPSPATALRQYPHQLSGGMRQRVVSIIALSAQPRLLIADEPTTSLDVTVQRDFIDLLLSLQQELGFGMIFVSHDLALIATFVHRVNVMYAGRIVESGNAASIFTRPGHPYTRALLDAIPKILPAPAPIRPIPGAPPRLGERLSGCPYAPRCPLALERCRVEQPPEVQIGAGHTARCWALGAGAT